MSFIEICLLCIVVCLVVQTVMMQLNENKNLKALGEIKLYINKSREDRANLRNQDLILRLSKENIPKGEIQNKYFMHVERFDGDLITQDEADYRNFGIRHAAHIREDRLKPGHYERDKEYLHKRRREEEMELYLEDEARTGVRHPHDPRNYMEKDDEEI